MASRRAPILAQILAHERTQICAGLKSVLADFCSFVLEKRYVKNASSVLVLDVSADKLELIQTVDVADISNPVVHDVILGPDDNFLYLIEVRKRRILAYSIRKDGRVARKGELVIPSPAFPLGLATT
jgi:hypothetical protein